MKKFILKFVLAGSILVPSLVSAASNMNSIFGQLDCSKFNGTLECWMNAPGGAFDWALGIVGSIAVVVIAAGGVIYMTSGGNPDQISKAKKLIFNALIGVAVLVLAKFFLTKIIGVPVP